MRQAKAEKRRWKVEAEKQWRTAGMKSEMRAFFGMIELKRAAILKEAQDHREIFVEHTATSNTEFEIKQALEFRGDAKHPTHFKTITQGRIAES